MGIDERARLGEILTESGLLTNDQLAAALAEQNESGRKLGQILIERELINEVQLHRALSQLFNTPFTDLSVVEPDPIVARAIPETMSRRHRMLVLEDKGDALVVAMAEPTNIFAYDELVHYTKRPIKLMLADENDIIRCIDQVYQHGDEIQDLVTELSVGYQELNKDEEISSSESDVPVIKLIATIFSDAARTNASDIHIEPDENVLRIRRRVDGFLHEQVLNEKHAIKAMVSRLKLISNLDISESRLPQDGRFNQVINNVTYDVRISTMPTQHGEAVVMRLLNQATGIPVLDQIGMTEVMVKLVRKAIQRPHGLILVTGPTGSGKTTTLYSAISELNKPDRKIITVEDPVEYRLPRISQVQVNQKIGLDFATVLHTTLRQDPDIVLIGEIRDRETAEIAMRAAITGHLVLSTLHTNSAVNTALRLSDMGVEPFLIASAVRAITAQRLIRKICDKCIIDAEISPGQTAWVKELLGERASSISFKKGEGCPACSQTGYRGRIAVHEILEINNELAEALRKNDFRAFEAGAENSDTYTPLLLSALQYAEEGMTSLDEVMRISEWVE